VFDASGPGSKAALPSMMRSKFEEATSLFDSEYNACRDVVAIGRGSESESIATVHVLQLREGLVAGQFCYDFEIPSGLGSDEDLAAAIQAVLERQHYPSGEAAPSGRFSFFPNEILSQYPVPDAKELKQYGLHSKTVSIDNFPGGFHFHHNHEFMRDVIAQKRTSCMFHMSWTDNKLLKIKFLQQMKLFGRTACIVSL
jgi:hypothetical protein